MNPQFSEADLNRIRAAVAEAEKRTSGEIVPYIVPQSDHYDVATWRGATMLMMAVLFIVLLLFEFYQGWSFGWLYTGRGTVLLVLFTWTLGALLAARIPAIKRMLVGEGLMAQTVHRRAMQAFVQEEVFSTRDRTGILLFISLFEHRIEVLGDVGINRHVTADEWVEVVATLRENIRAGHVTDGIVKAIEMCGALLERRGVEIRDDDENELSDDLRMPGL